jgi:hypothetical protein
MRRIRAACHSNDIQVETCTLLTVLNIIAAFSREGSIPLWGWMLAILFWPVFAFIGNFVSPIPKEF